MTEAAAEAFTGLAFNDDLREAVASAALPDLVKLLQDHSPPVGRAEAARAIALLARNDRLQAQLQTLLSRTLQTYQWTTQIMKPGSTLCMQFLVWRTMLV